MSAVDRPTIDELRRGEIAAAVKNGRVTPQEAEALVQDLDTPPLSDVSSIRLQSEPKEGEWCADFVASALAKCRRSVGRGHEDHQQELQPSSRGGSR